MDRQVGSRLILLASILTMVGLAAFSDVSRVLVLAVAVPLGFIAGAIFLLAVPFAAMKKGEEEPLGIRKLLDVLEHASPLAWLNFGILICTTGIAFMGLQGTGALYATIFGVALVAGMAAALFDVYLSEEPDKQQADWQTHP